MNAPRKIGSAYSEALRGLSDQFGKAYLESRSDVYVIDCHLIQGGTIICVSFVFQATGHEGWVPLEIGAEGWGEERRQKILEDANQVLKAREEIEREGVETIAKRVQEVLDALR